MVAAGEGRGPQARADAVLLPIKEGETNSRRPAYRAPLRQALIDDNARHVNIVVCETDYKALKRGIQHLPPAVQ